MNVTIYKTCELLAEPKPLIDTGASLIKAQWIPLLLTFLIIPFIFIMLLRRNIQNTKSLKKSEVKEKILLTFLFTIILQFGFYLFLMLFDYSIIIKLIHSII